MGRLAKHRKLKACDPFNRDGSARAPVGEDTVRQAAGKRKEGMNKAPQKGKKNSKSSDVFLPQSLRMMMNAVEKTKSGSEKAVSARKAPKRKEKMKDGESYEAYCQRLHRQTHEKIQSLEVKKPMSIKKKT